VPGTPLEVRAGTCPGSTDETLYEAEYIVGVRQILYEKKMLVNK